ncbi:MAG: hypothetical protein UZ03_NOB001002522 [Nitrospira sp. OLB3]|nr:MAG: hypothetical protein UZ03_NOB001002522 [Nitrospira sp. OLB3]
MWRVDQHILFTEGKIATYLEFTQGPVGELDRSAHVADPTAESSAPDEDGSKDQNDHDRGGIDGSLGERRDPHHRGLPPQFPAENVPGNQVKGDVRMDGRQGDHAVLVALGGGDGGRHHMTFAGWWGRGLSAVDRDELRLRRRRDATAHRIWLPARGLFCLTRARIGGERLMRHSS